MCRSSLQFLKLSPDLSANSSSVWRCIFYTLLELTGDVQPGLTVTAW